MKASGVLIHLKSNKEWSTFLQPVKQHEGFIDCRLDLLSFLSTTANRVCLKRNQIFHCG